jgi:hypothetical protein
MWKRRSMRLHQVPRASQRGKTYHEERQHAENRFIPVLKFYAVKFRDEMLEGFT